MTDVTLFGADDIRKIERINAEIAKNARLARRPERPMPLLFDLEDAPADDK